MHSGERVQSQSPAPEGAIGEAAVSADVPATASPAVAGQYPGRPPAARLGLHFEVWTSSTFRRSAPSGGVIAIFLVLLANVCLGQGSFSSPSNSNLAVRIQQLAADQRWPEIVRELESVPDKSVDLEFEYGSALAHVGRLVDARTALLAGQKLAPRDKRFLIELAGVEFKQKRPATAARHLRRALRINPADSYANDFLGTIYFIAGNLEAALKFWNLAGKPYIESVQPDHSLRTRPALVDRALAFSPASALPLADYETSRARLAGLGVFPSPRIRLIARPESKFDAVLNLQERNGFGDSLWQGLISTFSGIGYQTIYPEYFNIGGSAINVASLVRWDAQKRRLTAALSGPLHANPRWRYRLGFDLRNENWDIRESFTGPSPSLGSLNLRRESAEAEIESFNSGRWGWSAGAEFSHRDYLSVIAGSALASGLLLEGAQLKQLARVHYLVWLAPEHRFAINTEAASQIARIWSQPAQAFAKLQGSAESRWLPQMQGDDYDMRVRISGGGTAGQPPFDELYILGMERDNDLWLRGHVGTRNGRKGSAPLGTKYFLVNSEIDKNIYGNGLVTVKMGPFLDTGKIAGGAGNLGSRMWQWDTGAQAKMRVLGVGVTFVYGKDLRTGNNAFYFTAGRAEPASHAGFSAVTE
jgi:tetratricopeptide (TPR) repeat protein